MKENQSNSKNALTVAFLSALGNWIGDSILYPLETVSTRLKANQSSNVKPFTYFMESLKKQRFRLFKGVQLSFPAGFIPTFVYITAYDYGMKKASSIIQKYHFDKSSKLYFPFFVSSLAQIICLIIYLPIDTIRTRIQVDNQSKQIFKSIRYSLRQIRRREGISRFYKSSRLYFISKTLQTAITFQSFQMIRYFVGPSVFWMLTNTIISTAIATTLLNPLEVLITRYAIFDTTKKKLIFKNVVQKIIKEEGLKGFYKGYPTQLLHHCLSALFWLPLYQIVREYYGYQLQH